MIVFNVCVCVCSKPKLVVYICQWLATFHFDYHSNNFFSPCSFVRLSSTHLKTSTFGCYLFGVRVRLWFFVLLHHTCVCMRVCLHVSPGVFCFSFSSSWFANIQLDFLINFSIEVNSFEFTFLQNKKWFDWPKDTESFTGDVFEEFWPILLSCLWIKNRFQF